MSPREVQRLLDAYVAMQAQERLQLTETQYPQFLPRLKTLLDVRRASLAGRQALVADLGRASQGGELRAAQTTPRCAKNSSSCVPSTTRPPPTSVERTTPSTRCSTCGSRRASACSRIRSNDARSSC